MQVRSRVAGGGGETLVTQPASLHFLAGAYAASTPTALHLFNTSAYIASPARHALQHSLQDELAAFGIQVQHSIHLKSFQAPTSHQMLRLRN